MTFRAYLRLEGMTAVVIGATLCVAGLSAKHQGVADAIVAEAVLGTFIVVGLSAASGFWLTYIDFGVWAVVIGSIKAGPAAAAVARSEQETGTTFLVARRPWRGVLDLAEAPFGPAGDLRR